MACVKEYSTAIAFCAVMFCKKDAALRDEALKFLESRLGEVALVSEEIDFSKETDYYDEEMGATAAGGIKKIYAVFKKPMKREDLARLKTETNGFERKHAENGKRKVNLDPGYITQDKLVLASAKDYFHRIAIGEGIFAETTVHFTAEGKIRRFSWTYADYLLAPVQKILFFGRSLAKSEKKLDF